MSITIDATGQVVKSKKTRKVNILAGMKSRGGSEKRDYPKWREGWSTLDYVNAYHAANASVHLTQVTYTCK